MVSSVAERVARRYRYARLVKAMSMSEALQVLGFPPGANPSEDEVKKQQRRKTLEFHPDRGGDPEKMVEVNVAADVLLGKQRATPSFGGGGGYSTPDYGYQAPRQKPAEKVVSFEEAKASAGIPGDIEWMFVTTSHSSGYSSDEMANQATGWVAVGQTADAYIFVACEHYYSEDYFPGSLRGKIDVWSVRPVKWGKSKASGQKMTSVLVGGIQMAFKQFNEMTKKFNFKIIPVSEGWRLSDRLPPGRPTTVKNYVLDAGLMGEEELAAPRTYTIEVHYERPKFGEERVPPGFVKPGEYTDPFKLTFIVNGTKEYPLSESAAEKLYKLRIGGKRFLEWMFGDYYYGGETKNLTRKRDAKKIMAWMAENLPIPTDLKTALEAASTAQPQPAAQRGGYRRRRYG